MRLRIAFLLWFLQISFASDELISILNSPDSTQKAYLDALGKLESEPTTDQGLAALGEAYFFGRRNIIKPDYEKAFKVFSQSKSAEAMYFTSLCYAQGLGTERSPEKALLYLNFAAKNGSNSARLALAYRYAAGIGVAKSCSKSRDHYFYPAESVAKVYEVNKHFYAPTPIALDSIKSNPRTSQTDMVEFYEYSADKDEVGTLLLLGQIYYEGYSGSAVDYKLAKHYFERASAAGAANADGYLGEMHLYGLGVPKDPKRAFKYFRKGTKGNSPIAKNGLGILYRDGIEVQQDLNEALKLFIQAADDGLAEAQYNAGCLLHKLHPLTHDDKSMAYLAQAFHQGYVLAQFEMAKRNMNNLMLCMFNVILLRTVVENGPEMLLFEEAYQDYKEGDPEVALSKYIFLADHGHQMAQFNAAKILLEAKSYRRAMVYLHRSANQGNVQARLQFGDLFYYGHGLPRPDLITAFLAYKEAFAKNSPQASFNLAYMYQHGLGVPKDLLLARRFYDSAVAFGSKRMPEAWLPVSLAILWMQIREFRSSFFNFRYWSLLITFALMLGTLRFFLARLRPRRHHQAIQ